MKRLRATLRGAACWATLAAGTALAQPALHIWPEADLALGQKLIQEHACTTCHDVMELLDLARPAAPRRS